MILVAREKKYKKTVCQMLFKCYLAQTCKNFSFCLFFNCFWFFSQQLNIIFFIVKTIFNWNFQSIATSTVQLFAYNFSFNWSDMKYFVECVQRLILCPMNLIELLRMLVCPPHLLVLTCTLTEADLGLPRHPRWSTLW